MTLDNLEEAIRELCGENTWWQMQEKTVVNMNMIMIPKEVRLTLQRKIAVEIVTGATGTLEEGILVLGRKQR